MANRIVQLIEGFKEILPRTIQIKMANLNNYMDMKTLSNNMTHLIIFEWFDQLIDHICNSDVYSAIRDFKHISFHTIEAYYKVANMSDVIKYDDVQICNKSKNVKSSISFAFALSKMDLVMSGLDAMAGPIQNLLTVNGQVVPVKYVPVPISVIDALNYL